MDYVEATNESQEKVKERALYALHESGPMRPMAFEELLRKTEASPGSLAVVLTGLEKGNLEKEEPALVESVWENGESKMRLTPSGRAQMIKTVQEKEERRRLLDQLTRPGWKDPRMMPRDSGL